MKLIRRVPATLAVMISGIVGVAQSAAGDVIAQYNFDAGTYTTSTNAAAISAMPSTAIAGVTATSLTASTALIGVDSGNNNKTSISTGVGNSLPSMYLRSSITPSTESLAVLNNQYMTFTVTPGLDRALSLSSLSFDAAVASVSGTFTIAGSYIVRSSVDNYASNLSSSASVSVFTINYTGNGNSQFTTFTVDLSGASYQQITGPVTFRIYVFDNLDTPLVVDRLDNITLQGAVVSAPIPEPTALGLLGTGFAGLLYCSLLKRH